MALNACESALSEAIALASCASDWNACALAAIDATAAGFAASAANLSGLPA